MSLVGLAFFEVLPDRPGTVHIRQMATHPDCQGKGVGTALLNRVKAVVDVNRVIADTRRINVKAVGFYLRQGFVMEKRTRDPGLDGRWYCGLTCNLKST